MLIIVCGLPGSGKSTLARALSKRLGAVHLSSDLIRKRLFPDPKYSAEEKAMVYGEMAGLCAKSLSEGKDVIADATFYKERTREDFRSIARRAGERSYVILCRLDERIIRGRLGRRRKGGPSDADYKVYLRMKGEFEPVRGGRLVVDSALPMRRRLAMVERYVGAAHG